MMITKIVLGNGEVLENVGDMQETIENDTNYTRRNLNIHLKGEEQAGIEIGDIEEIFSRDNVLTKIEVYKKDSVERVFDEDYDDYIEIFGEEYLSDTFTEYTGIVSIYKSIDSGRISVHLSTNPSNLADDKYIELVEENRELKLIIDTMLGVDDIE